MAWRGGACSYPILSFLSTQHDTQHTHAQSLNQSIWKPCVDRQMLLMTKSIVSSRLCLGSWNEITGPEYQTEVVSPEHWTEGFFSSEQRGKICGDLFPWSRKRPSVGQSRHGWALNSPTFASPPSPGGGVADGLGKRRWTDIRAAL